jgi:cardiolipin synthase A/B
MKLITQPDDGIAPVTTAIKQAQKTIDVMIFRLDRPEIARALETAVSRGVAVRALIAHKNSGGEKRLLETGVTVSRTADDLVRYHGKMMIVDSRVLHLYGFNFTALDIEKSRSFGVITRNAGLVKEAIRLFEADCARQPYVPASNNLVISPENARERLAEFISHAKKQLLIYDPKVSDPAMLRLLADRVAKGVDVRILGRLGGKKPVLTVEKYPGKRLHVRTIIRDGERAFVGSQSLRKLELEQRREVGLFVTDAAIVRQLLTFWEQDWAQTDTGRKQAKKAEKKDGKEAAISLQS